MPKQPLPAPRFLRSNALHAIGHTAMGLSVAWIHLPIHAAERFVDMGDLIAQKAYEQMAELEKIADANGGTRAVGTPGYEASASHVERQLLQAGYRVQRQWFPWEQRYIEKNEVQVLSDAGRTLHSLPLFGSKVPATPEGGAIGALHAPRADGCAGSDWSGLITGIALLPPPEHCDRPTQIRTAKDHGAHAVLAYGAYDWLDFIDVGDADGMLPGAMIAGADGRQLHNDMEANRVTLKVDASLGVARGESFNLIAERGPMEHASKVFMAGAHLDSIDEGPGINDNASGAAVLLASALHLPETAIGVRLAWWGAEEVGLFGSRYYVNNLQSHHPEELASITGYLNLDMVASPNYIIGKYGTQNSEILAALNDALKVAGSPSIEVGGNGGSDFEPFRDAGIPYAGLLTGASGPKTTAEVRLFGGQEGEDYDPNYHSARDRLDKVSMRALRINAEATYWTITAMSR